jgi:hypothetical protein
MNNYVLTPNLAIHLLEFQLTDLTAVLGDLFLSLNNLPISQPGLLVAGNEPSFQDLHLTISVLF